MVGWGLYLGYIWVDIGKLAKGNLASFGTRLYWQSGTKMTGHWRKGLQDGHIVTSWRSSDISHQTEWNSGKPKDIEGCLHPKAKQAIDEGKCVRLGDGFCTFYYSCSKCYARCCPSCWLHCHPCDGEKFVEFCIDSWCDCRNCSLKNE